jgi:DNA-directed RNA polymerase sigma subunit (sigma70/sigma32)
MLDEHDSNVEEFIHAHPNGATLEDISHIMGISKQACGQHLNTALHKLRKTCSARGLDREWLEELERVTCLGL